MVGGGRDVKPSLASPGSGERRSFSDMATQRLEADLEVGAFGMLLDGANKRLDFPRGEVDNLQGSSGNVTYGAREVVLDKLHTLLGRTHWQAEAGSAGDMWLKVGEDAFGLSLDRLELSRGMRLTRSAHGGVEILAPHASFNDVTIKIPHFDHLRGAKAAEVASLALQRVNEVPLRQSRLRFLDTLTGEISVTVKVVLDLPVLGKRTLDQVLKIPIKDGSLDYRALQDSLDWLEGTFLELGIKNDRLVLSWGVPILVKQREILSWELDDEARTLATFDRVPLRSLADFRLAASRDLAAAAAGVATAPDKNKKKNPLRSLTLSDLKVNLSMTAPQSVEVGHGAIMFGGDGEPGIVGLQLRGSLVHPPGPGVLTGSVGVLDVTVKDLAIGSATLTADRLHLGAIERFDLTFDGFRPIGLTATIARITATNLALELGSQPPSDPDTSAAR